MMISQQTLINDIEKHCRNKRLKKNIFKMECSNRILPQPYNSITLASSDTAKWSKQIIDPIIDNQFKKLNMVNYQSIMQNEAAMLFSTKV